MTEKGDSPLTAPESSPGEIRDHIVKAALALGFARVAVVRLAPPTRFDECERWLERGYHGEMAFMETPVNRKSRAGYGTILEGAKSAIVVAAAYGSEAPEPEVGRGRVAKYTFGEDYHHLLKSALAELAEGIESLIPGVQTRPCTDTAPILERDLAARAGLGFIGKNTMLISPGLGSYTLLGELFTTAELMETEPVNVGDRCGSCRACLDACPTGAFPEPYVLDARRCISYLTIEHRGAIDPELHSAMGDWVFGCDVCQDVCPYNKQAPKRHVPFPGLEGKDSPRRSPALADMLGMSTGDYKRLTRGSAMNRARRDMLKRNAAIAIANGERED